MFDIDNDDDANRGRTTTPSPVDAGDGSGLQAVAAFVAPTQSVVAPVQSVAAVEPAAAKIQHKYLTKDMLRGPAPSDEEMTSSPSADSDSTASGTEHTRLMAEKFIRDKAEAAAAAAAAKAGPAGSDVEMA